MSGVSKFISHIVKGISHAISSVVKTVADIIKSLAGTIARIAVNIGKSVAGITSYLGKALSQIMPEMLTGININIGSLAVLLLGGNVTLAGYAGKLFDLIKKYRKSTHDKVAQSVTDIAYLAGLNYDIMTDRVFLQIKNVSRQLKVGDHTLMLILEDARTKTMAASNLMGRGFDLNQIGWLKDMSIILNKMSKNINRYMESPWKLIKDIDGWVIRKVIDTSAKSQQFNSMALEKLAEGLKGAANQLKTVRDKLNKHIDKLPGFIKDKIKPEINKVNKTIDKFIDYTYLPTVTAIDKAIDGIDDLNTVQDKQIADILRRIKYPGSYLTEIDELSADEKLNQEEKVSDMSGRVLGYDTKDFKDQSQKVRDRLSELRDRLKEKLPPPPWDMGEEKLPKRTAREKASLKDTWFVGDY